MSPDRVVEVRDEDLEGAVIAGYQIEHELHRGGQGVVYRAIQLGTKRQVALKVLLEGRFASESTRRRFEREVELAASLRHPHIVTILDSGISAGRYYFAMEYIAGERLDRYLAKVRPSLRSTLEVFAKTAAAVNYAHQRGVIHRDLKPPNILVDSLGEPHILDFGLAKPAGISAKDQSTMRVLSIEGQLLGTVAYMSPEQSLGSQDVDVRSDVYSLGVVFYEALLGQLPYSVEGPLGEVLMRIVESEPVRPRVLRARCRFGGLVDEEVETILLRALEKDPARRYQSAGDLGRDIGHLLAGEPIEAKRASAWYVFRKLLRRYRLRAALAATALVMLVAFLISFAFLWSRERDAKAEADRHRETALQREINERQARQELQRALAQQTIQRGKLSQARGDLVAARDFYWEAAEQAAGPAATWALRQYYLQSGDEAAGVVLVGNEGLVALSPNGELAAVCEAPRSIVVRGAQDGLCVRWLSVPREVSALRVADDGTVCAAGPGWARWWSDDSTKPKVAADLPISFDVRGIFPDDRGQRLLLLGGKEVRAVDASTRKRQRGVRLFGEPTGAPDYSAEQAMLAVPTTAGVELVLVDEQGELRAELIGLKEVAPRLVRFAGDELLAATDEAVYVTPAGPLVGDWRRYSAVPLDWRPPVGWEHVDVEPRSGSIVFGLRDGRVVLFRGGRLRHIWEVATRGLLGLRIVDEGAAVVTVDAAGTITRWTTPDGESHARLILDRPAAWWACAEDGSAVLLADARARVFAYAPGYGEEPESLPVRRSLRLRLPGEQQVALAASRNADRAVVCTDNMIRVRDRLTGNTYSAVWSGPAVDVLKDAAITGDGQLLAFCAQTSAGDRQEVSFWRWEPQVQTTRSVELPALLPQSGRAVEFVGSVIKQMLFVPGTPRLLVARSNGELHMLDARGAVGVGSAGTPEPWARLDTPPAALAFNRSGSQLAVAGVDGWIHVLATRDATVLARLHVAEPGAICSIAYGPRGDVLLVRTGADRVSIVEIASGEAVAEFELQEGDAGALATWIGKADAMLLSHGDGVRAHTLDTTDSLIARNRAYALRRAVSQHLAEGRFADAWAEARRVGQFGSAGVRELQRSILEAALRRANLVVDPEWQAVVLRDADAGTLLRLGHAAYAGERFDLAREWLAAAVDGHGGVVDSCTALRLAQCTYLAGEYEEAAALLTDVLTRPDLLAGDVAMTHLQRIAALVLGDEVEAARLAMRELDQFQVVEGIDADSGAINAARDIARRLTGLEEGEPVEAQAERPVVAVFGRLVGEVTAESLRGFYQRFYDDVHFFAAELALHRGDHEQAAADYQRCIDVARDPWPANWARFRLRQLLPDT